MRASLVSAAIVGTALAAEPCAQVAEAVKAAKGYAHVKPSLAVACMESVPVDKSGDILQLEGLIAFNNFQSDLAFLENPPAGYPYPPVDFLGGLRQIQTNVKNNKYSSEYEVQLAIIQLYYKLKDGHTYYVPDILGVFEFSREMSIYSISKDGTSVPSTYAEPDLAVLAGVTKNAGYTPSAISKINGEDVEQWLETTANTTAYDQHDPDAAYNQVFPIVPDEQAHGFGPGILFRTLPWYQGDTTTFTFANGSTRDVYTYAFAGGSLANKWASVTDGSSFFKAFCSRTSPSGSASASSQPSQTASGAASGSASGSAAPASASSAAAGSSSVVSSSAALAERAAASSSAVVSGSRSSGAVAPTPASASASGGSTGTASAVDNKSQEVKFSAVASQSVIPSVSAAAGSQYLSPPPAWYPKPLVEASDHSIACYFPSEISDLTVLSIPTFDPNNYVEFSDVIRQCLATSLKMGKSRLIVDLRANGGGHLFSGFDAFKQIFPGAVPYSTSNFRAWSLFETLTRVVTNEYAGVSTTPYKASLNAASSDFATLFDINNQWLNENDQDFSSWEDFYGPVSVNGGQFTHLVRYNLSNFYTTDQYVTDYGKLAGYDTKQVFSAKNIMLLQDGQCASTCTVFSEFMKEQEDIGSVVMGGRAQLGPMQGVAGTKGAEDIAFNSLGQWAKNAVRNAPKAEQAALEKQYGNTELAVKQAIDRAYFTGPDSPTGPNINLRNQIRDGDDTLTPLQFVYEAADCRLFYTAESYFNQAFVWEAAYKAYWKGASCVSGSTGQDSSKPGNSYILASPGATAVPTTPKSAMVSSTSSGAGIPMATAAMAAIVPAFAAGAMLF